MIVLVICLLDGYGSVFANNTSVRTSQSQEYQVNKTSGQFLENPIPQWVKNNVKSWATGNQDSTSFVQALYYLIVNEMFPSGKSYMVIHPGLAHQIKIPEWIKTTAGWWTDGKISDRDFIGGMKYLVSSGIIQI